MAKWNSNCSTPPQKVVGKIWIIYSKQENGRRVRIPDLYIPQRSRYSKWFSLFIKPAYRHSLTLQALFAFYWETQKRNLQLTFFTMAPVRPRQHPPRGKSILCLYKQGDLHCRPLCQRPFGSLQIWWGVQTLSIVFTFLLTNRDVVLTEVEQLYQKTYL